MSESSLNLSRLTKRRLTSPSQENEKGKKKKSFVQDNQSIMSSWSDLSSDLLAHITGLLSLLDQRRFSSVCQNWRFIAKHKAFPPVSQLPWLVLGEDSKTLNPKRNFLSLSEKKHYSFDIPELYGHLICGSSHGWLITVGKRIEGRIINPFTRECFELPPFPPFCTNHNIDMCTNEPVYDSTGRETTYTFKRMQRMIVKRAILSHDPKEKSDFTVVILFGSPQKLALWRPGESDWKVINSPYCALEDICYFQGELYVVTRGGSVVYILDPLRNYVVSKKIENQDEDMIGYWKYFVAMERKLLLIKRFQKYETKRTERFEVHELNDEKMRWCKVDNINDISVFVGNNSPVIVDPSEIPMCIRNGIYFTDGTRDSWVKYGHDFGVHDMVQDITAVGRFSSNSDNDDNYGDIFLPPDAALTWFTPNL